MAAFKGVLLFFLFLVSALIWAMTGTDYEFGIFSWLTTAGGYIIAFSAGVVAATKIDTPKP